MGPFRPDDVARTQNGLQRFTDALLMSKFRSKAHTVQPRLLRSTIDHQLSFVDYLAARHTLHSVACDSKPKVAVRVTMH